MRILFPLLLLVPLAATAQDAIPILPDLAKTPGPANKSLAQPDICNSAFSTKPFRKPSKSKRRCVTDRYGKPSYPFTYDHLVPLELGGLDSCDNLWPEPRGETRRKKTRCRFTYAFAKKLPESRPKS